MPSCFETSHTSPSFILTTSFRAVTEIHTPLKETMVALHFNAPHMHSYIVIFKCTNCQGLQLLIWWRFHYMVIFLDLLLLVVPTEGVIVVTSNSNCYNLLLSTLQCVISHVFIPLINEECPMLPNYTLNLKLNIILWRPYTHTPKAVSHTNFWNRSVMLYKGFSQQSLFSPNFPRERASFASVNQGCCTC